MISASSVNFYKFLSYDYTEFYFLFLMVSFYEWKYPDYNWQKE